MNFALRAQTPGIERPPEPCQKTFSLETSLPLLPFGRKRAFPVIKAPTKKRVVILYNTALYIYNFRRGLIKALQTSGYEVIAVSPHDSAVAKLERLGVTHVPFPLIAHNLNPLKELGSLVQLFRILRALRPANVLSYTIKCNLYAGLMSHLVGFKQVANIPGLGRAFDSDSRLKGLAVLLYRLCLRKAARVFFQNKQDLEELTQVKAVPQDRGIVVAGSGVDLKAFNHLPYPPEDPLIFLIAGRLIPRKGFDRFLQAARELKGSGCEFWVAGQTDSGNVESETLLKRLQAAEEEGCIKYLGWVENMSALMAKSHVVVLPSTYNEGIPRSLIEALAIGRVIITTDWKGCRETINTTTDNPVYQQGVHLGENGCLIDPSVPDSLSAACRKLLNRTFAERVDMSSKSRAYAEEKFNEQDIIDLYLQEVANA